MECTYFPCSEDEEDANLVFREMDKFKGVWGQVAIYFGTAPDTVEDIKKKHPGDNAGALQDLIYSWVRQQHNVAKFGYPCWRKVVEAAVGAGNRLQAKKIAKAHPGQLMAGFRCMTHV